MSTFKYILMLIILSFGFSRLDIDWSLEINAHNSSDLPIVMGYCDECHDGFHYGAEDLYDQVPDVLTDLNLYFQNFKWIGSQDENNNTLQAPAEACTEGYIMSS